MLPIDSDILIDAARKDSQALAFIADPAAHHVNAAATITLAVPLASKNQKLFRAISRIELLPWPAIATP